MSDKTARWLYWISTGLVALVYFGAGVFYISMHQMVAGMYEQVLHYPTYLIWPLAILKIVAAVVILWRPNAMITDWAYASMFWHLLLAASAHLSAGDPGWPPAVVTWVALIVSWLTANRVRRVKSAYAPGGEAERA
ncbi:MAG: DoxX family protein [Alphaproteobacteria bacterium]|nr:MAG: DoxX family protein [Alphaproteobacteria bacterium]